MRKIRGGNGSAKLQIRMDLGLDATRVAGAVPTRFARMAVCRCWIYYCQKRREWEEAHGPGTFSLSHEDCSELAQEAMKILLATDRFF